MDFVIAVRTYKRPDMFRTHTLQVIQEQGLLDHLHVFVGSDIEEYRALEPDLRYVQVPVGGANAIRAICEYFPRGTKIVFMDDDLQRYRSYNWEIDSFETTGLGAFCAEAFSHAPFTIGWLTNKFWLRKQPRFKYRAGTMAGAFFGAINEPELIVTTHAHLDDDLRAIQYMKQGRIPTIYPGVSFKTDYATNPGGLQASGDRDDTKRVCEEVAPQVEGWVSGIYQQPCGYWAWKLLPHRILIRRIIPPSHGE